MSPNSRGTAVTGGELEAGASTVDKVRMVVLGVCLGLMIVARVISPLSVVIITLVGVFVATRRSTKITVGALGSLIAVGVPWIAAPLVAGLIWIITAKGFTVAKYHHSQSPSVRRFASTVVLGLLCGLVAIPFTQAQLTQEPIQVNLVRPSFGWLVVAVVVLASANAVGEELIWRGMLLAECRGVRAPAIYIIQAASFGTAHFYGLPGGFIGCILTGFSALVFVFLHRRWGYRASIGAHFIADLIIFASAVPSMLFVGWCAESCAAFSWI